MRNSKLINLFKSFSAGDWKEFEKFAVSPYLNNGRNYIPLIKEIEKYYPDFNSGELSKQSIYKKLFPLKVYKDTVMKSMLTGLLKLAEKFILIDYLEKEDIEKKNLLFQAYAERGNFEGLFNTLKSIDNIISNSKIDYEYFNHKGAVESGKVLYYQRESDKYVKYLEHYMNRGNYIIMELILKLPQVLNDTYYSHTKFNESRQKDISFAFANSFDFIKFVKQVDSSDFQYKEICKLFTYTALLMTDDKNTDNFFKAKKLYEECFDDLSFQNQYIIGLLLSNYCVSNKSVSSNVFANEGFKISDFMLRKNIFFGVHRNFIPHTPFMQYFNLACECGKLKIAEDYINKYSINLHEKHRDQVSKRCRAQLFILNNNFNEALELLKDFNSDDITEIIDLKRLQSMIYYELCLYDNLDYTINSTLKLLKSNKFVADSIRNGIMIFFKNIKKLAKIRQKRDKNEAYVLLKKIQGGEYFLLSYWIMNKLKEVE